MFHLRRTAGCFVLPLLACSLSYTLPGATDGQDGQYGPKVEPPAMGSDYQPLLWRGTDAEFVLDTVGFGTCQTKVSGQAASKSSNTDIQHLAAQSMEQETRMIKKLKSMAKAIGFRFPKDPPPCPEESDLAQLSGEKFDEAYLSYLSRDNADEVGRLQAEADAKTNSSNFNLRKFAAANSPLLSEQQTSIDAVRRRLTPDTK